MKTLSKFSLLIIVSVLLTAKLAYAQKGRLLNVKLEWQDFATESFSDVGCESFEQVFKKTIETRSINDASILTKFHKVSKCFTKETEYKSLDVRGIISLNFGNKKERYCFDKFGHFYKNGSIKNNHKLFTLIKEVMNYNN